MKTPDPTGLATNPADAVVQMLRDMADDKGRNPDERKLLRIFSRTLSEELSQLRVAANREAVTS